MGSNSTFFFQPGVPSRNNPNTPVKNYELTSKIGDFHASALDKIGSLYYTKASFDDFYYGKGSTYPDINGGIGILFEQASSRGHAQETDNGILKFPFTVRNQFITSLSTQDAGIALKNDILEYKREFFKEGQKLQERSSTIGYLVSDKDKSKLDNFANLLHQHDIDVYSGENDNNIYVPCDQYQYRLVNTIFEKVTTFNDSIFYDVSTWTLPLAYNLQVKEIKDKNYFKDNKFSLYSKSSGNVDIIGDPSYAFMFSWEDYYAPTLLYSLMNAGLRCKVMTEPFTFNINGQKVNFKRGSVMVPIQNQKLSKDKIRQLIASETSDGKFTIYGLSEGTDINGKTLGLPSTKALALPKVAMAVGGSVRGYDAGEIWHLLDTRYHIPLSKIEWDRLSRNSLRSFNTLILADGRYESMPKASVIALKEWTKNGGNLILMEGASRWAAKEKIINLKKRESETTDEKGVPYAQRAKDSGSKVLGGSIFNTSVDLTHPLLYGYGRTNLPVFKSGTTTYDVTGNAYATPISYTDKALLSGYMPRGYGEKIANGAVLTCHSLGSGRVIAFQDNVNFRGFWWGTNKLFANAIFYGPVIERGALQRTTGE